MNKKLNIDKGISYCARACARNRRYLFLKKAHSTGLITFALLSLFGPAASQARMKIVKAAESARFDDMRATKSIEIKRTNAKNGAFETLRLDKKKFTLAWSTGRKSSLPVTPEQFDALDKEVRGAGEVPAVKVPGRDNIVLEIAVVTRNERRELAFDPDGKLHHVFEEFMRLRNEALKNGH